VNIIDAGYRLAADRDDNIALFQTGAMGRTVRGHIYHLYPGIMTKLEIPDHTHRQGHSLSGNAEEAADNLAFPDKPGDHPAHGIHRYGKANTLGVLNNRRIDTYDRAVGVH
jgi:hypothetical protein